MEETINKIQDPIIEYKFDSENHIHKYLDKPLLGTSTVVGVIAKPLTWWASGLACEKLGWTNSKKKIGGKYLTIALESRISHAEHILTQIKGMDTTQYLSLLDEAYKAHSVKLDKSADEGTDLHAELERYVKYKMGTSIEGNFSEKIIPFITWAEENVEEFLWSELHCYSDRLWVGGISDCGVRLKNGDIGIIDFKSSKESYESQFIQCAGYDIQITENGGFTNNGYPIFKLKEEIKFYAIVPFGSPEFTIDFRFNTEELKKGFESAVTLYKLTNK